MIRYNTICYDIGADDRLKKHARNEGKVVRIMPDLKDQQ
jgi:hypothetical protein